MKTDPRLSGLTKSSGMLFMHASHGHYFDPKCDFFLKINDMLSDFGD